MSTKPRRIEPWLDAYQRSLQQRREPLLFLLVSRVEAQVLVDGVVPTRLKLQAEQMLNGLPDEYKL